MTLNAICFNCQNDFTPCTSCGHHHCQSIQCAGAQPLQIGYAITREQWLNNLANQLRPLFVAVGHPLPEKVRISIGFTSVGKGGRRIGECWDSSNSRDGHFEIFIVPNLAYKPSALSGEIAAILAHELTHAAVGIRASHGPVFKKCATAIGLVGKMTATVAGPEFIKAIEPVLAKVGPLPHAQLVTGGLSTAPKKQNNRHIRVKCEECGYLARVARKHLDIAALRCPVCDVEMTE